MIKLLHYIKEDYSGDIERHCLDTCKKIYPDFELCAWRPGSSPLRILYDNGGLFIGPNILLKKQLPDSFFEKPTFVFDNKFESVSINQNLVCYSDKPNSPIFLEFMEKGIENTLKEKGLKNDYKVGLSEKDYDFDDFRILNRYTLGFDKGYLELYDSPFLDMNINYNTINNVHLHYFIINKNVEANDLYRVADYYGGKFKPEDGSAHYMLFINNTNPDKYDLVSRMMVFSKYLCTDTNKFFGIINTGNTDSETLNKIVIEYIGRKFNNLKSCEKWI